MQTDCFWSSGNKKKNGYGILVVAAMMKARSRCVAAAKATLVLELENVSSCNKDKEQQ